MSKLSVIAFPGAPNLPVFAAMERGYLDHAGIELDFQTTPSSVFQFEQFGTGKFDVAFTAFDNVVAYSEKQGVAMLPTQHDYRAVMGCTQLALSFVVSPHIRTPADVEGRSLAVDAVNTGFAFALYHMLSCSGVAPEHYQVAPVGSTPDRWRSVKEGVHDGTITIEPFTSIANANGFPTLLNSSDFLPNYQGGVIAVRRDWAEANGDLLSAFLGVYRRGLDWVLDPANREAAAAILAARMPEIQPKVLQTVMRSLLSPTSGLTPNGAILRDGARAVLDLRTRYGSGAEPLTDVDKYLDLRWMKNVPA
ncbi:ABC transporter substrate-binding protein [Bradyrhizobium sp. 14AA]